MGKKKILIVCPDSIYPLKMGSQVRMFNMIKHLHRDHSVEVIARIPSKKYFDPDYRKEIDKICQNYYPVLSSNQKNIYLKIYHKFIRLLPQFRHLPSQLYYNSIPAFQKRIIKIIQDKKYDIVLTFYWYMNSFYRKLTYKPHLVLDTININFKKYEADLKAGGKLEIKRKRLLKYQALELKYTALSDIIVSVSELDLQFFKNKFPHKKHLKIPIGQDLSSYLNYKPGEKTNSAILFYGSMRSNQNISAFTRFYDRIYPEIKQKVPEVKLIVLGADPPEKIKKLHNGSSIFITGYVEDLKEWISKASVMILPLELGGGFRTRIVEVMAMGIPVIGTHNALDSIEMVNAVHGYISDKNSEMANYAVQLLKNPGLRKKMSDDCKKFVAGKYSLEATYGRLSDYFSGL